jgi:hypothetical protein
LGTDWNGSLLLPEEELVRALPMVACHPCITIYGTNVTNVMMY